MECCALELQGMNVRLYSRSGGAVLGGKVAIPCLSAYVVIFDDELRLSWQLKKQMPYCENRTYSSVAIIPGTGEHEFHNLWKKDILH